MQLSLFELNQIFLSGHQCLLGNVLVSRRLQPAIHELTVSIIVWLAAGSPSLAKSSCDGSTTLSLYQKKYQNTKFIKIGCVAMVPATVTVLL